LSFVRDNLMRPVQPLPAVLAVDETPSIRELLIHTLHDLVPYAVRVSRHSRRSVELD
jgi:hypothetical protein